MAPVAYLDVNLILVDILVGDVTCHLQRHGNEGSPSSVLQVSIIVPELRLMYVLKH